MTDDKACILVVDDDNAVRSSIAEILRRQNYLVIEASSGENALPHLLEDPVDVVLLDVRMPGMDGLTVLEKLKQIAPDVIVIMMTAYADKETVYEALRRHRAYDLMEKPMHPQALLTVVQEGVTHRHAVQRKSMGAGEKPNTRQMPRILVGCGLMLDVDRAEAYAGSQRLSLTRSEFWLLANLVYQKERLMRPSEIVAVVQGYQIDDNQARDIVRPLVSRLRKKLEPFPGSFSCIINVRGGGYMFTEQSIVGAEDES